MEECILFWCIKLFFANKYILDATIRREGSSRFSPIKDSVLSGLWAGWNIHKENFVPKFFNELKLRTSYGLTGNSGVGINAYQATLSHNVAYGWKWGVLRYQLW